MYIDGNARGKNSVQSVMLVNYRVLFVYTLKLRHRSKLGTPTALLESLKKLIFKYGQCTERCTTKYQVSEIKSMRTDMIFTNLHF